jgi:hypothetical protein
MFPDTKKVTHLSLPVAQFTKVALRGRKAEKGTERFYFFGTTVLQQKIACNFRISN